MNEYPTRAGFDPASSLALLRRDFSDTELYSSPFRLVLESLHRALFSSVDVISPSLEIGIRDGLSSSFVHHGKRKFDWGGDMPLFATHESLGLDVPRRFMNYHALIGMDATDIPFLDGSFHTIAASQVGDYGMDKKAFVSEMFRALRPGGTLAFTVATPLFKEYPHIFGALKGWVPGLEGVKPAAWWAEQLADLGATNITVRHLLAEDLGAVLLSEMFTGKRFASIVADHLSLREMKLVYEESWEFFRARIAAELGHEPERSWFVFISAQRRDGTVSDPVPVCATCRSGRLERSDLRHVCRDCGAEYTVEFGIPIYVRDPSRVYSAPSGTTLLYKRILRPYPQEKITRYLRRRGSRWRGRDLFVIGSGEVARFVATTALQPAPAQLHWVDDPGSVPASRGDRSPCFVLAARPTRALLWLLRDRRLLFGCLAGRTLLLPSGILSTIDAAVREVFLRLRVRWSQTPRKR